jgi:hypothetical protein
MDLYAVIMVWDIKSNVHLYKTTAANLSVKANIDYATYITLLRNSFGDALEKTIKAMKAEYGSEAEITLLSHSITKM